MKSIIIPVLLAASVSLLPARHVEAQPKKGGPPPAAPATTGDEGPVVVLKDLKPGTAVRVKWQNNWTDGKVVRVDGSQVQVQIGGSKDWFTSEKVWGTEEQRDNTAAGGYIDTFVRANFESFKVAVAEAEAVKKSGADAATVRAAVDKAEQILKQDYGKAGRHPRIGPFLVRYWAMATSKVDELAAEVVADAEKAAELNDRQSWFSSSTPNLLSGVQIVLDEYKAFQTTPNAETERLDKVMADATAKIEAARAKVVAGRLESARVPKEIYKGGDAKALKAKVTAEWKKQFPDKPILKLVISTEWDHERTWKTNAGGGYWYDWTTIYMDLVVKKDATTATVYPVGLFYQDGNKKKMKVSAGDVGFGNYRPFDMLLKNVNAK